MAVAVRITTEDDPRLKHPSHAQITAALDVSQPKMSRHLAALRALGVVEDSRVANRVFYRLHPALPSWARGVVDRLAARVTATHDFGVIAARLQAMPNRPAERAEFDRAAVVVEGEEIGHAV